jgi:hypothetical protein
MICATQSALYERLFLLNRCMEQAAEIVVQFHQDGLIHAEYAAHRKEELEALRADLCHVLTGLLHQRELEACVKTVGTDRAMAAKSQQEPNC